MDVGVNESNPYEATQDHTGGTHPSDDDSSICHPERIDRYRVKKVLGKGGFGLVYLAHDEGLDRLVALKVPHAHRVSRVGDADAYLAEARLVASLDHPNIVPVHDVGSTDQYPCYVVSKYIEGTDLATKIRNEKLDGRQAVEIVATVAEALHFAHQRGIVHRDVKPGNILMDVDGNPHVVDFGLALREENIGKGPRYAGTPAYMSPEQARGEGHRVDGRCDVFSLGAVLYRLLVGRPPFRGDTQSDLLDQVVNFDPRPLRQHDDGIPKEVERICLKALAKRATERYTTATDFAEDLRYFLAQPSTIQSSISTGDTATVSDTYPAPPSPTMSTSSSLAASGLRSFSDSHPIRIVPKGLRSFDAHDADFFLELLPGPRDRDGLPDSLRFWKSRIEETDSDNTFPVGLIYGPSGCGKSSLIKAGLIPRLPEHVISVYIEATPEETESRLLQGLRKRCPAVEDNLSLKDTLAALRRGLGIPFGRKVIIILDQFEQWLHAKGAEESTELVEALRQCDGGRVQCVVLVRDDFWLAASRFMGELEVGLVQGENMALTDLFDLAHARSVLAAFGRAFGQLPEHVRDTSKDQHEFIKTSVAGLAEDGKVICVRLALLAEMTKGRDWTLATLREMGGTKGVGVTFLEETFSTQKSLPQYRLHEKAARAVLNALLPESGTDIKGQMKSYGDLLEASGYATKPKEFDELIRLLDSDVRLITPTDPEGIDVDDDSVVRNQVGQKYFQLTHDYLVHPLREWLTRKQRETPRGRAELQLAERTSLWKQKPENRYLPTLPEYVSIVRWTHQSDWKPSERKMMRRATTVLGTRWGGGILAVVVVAVLILQMYRMSHQRNQLEQVRTAVASMSNLQGGAVPYGMRELERFPREMIVEELRARRADCDEIQKLALSYALAHFGSVDVDYLIDVTRDSLPEESKNIIAALTYEREGSLPAVQAAAEKCRESQQWRLEARYAVIALHFGVLQLASDMVHVADGGDPLRRTAFVDECRLWGGDPVRLAQLAPSIEDSTLRYCLGLACGSDPRLTATAKEAWRIVLVDWYQDQSNAGPHAAADWVLRQWYLPSELPAIAPAQDLGENDQWYVNRVGITMVKIPAGSYRPTSRIHENPGELVDEPIAVVQVQQPFLISDREISLALFRQFMADDDPDIQKPESWVPYGPDSTSDDLPVNSLIWGDAIRFCNWLSRKEGFKPYYKISGTEWSVVDEEGVGYRIPTTAEWEQASRAGTGTGHFSGNDDLLLGHYAVFRTNNAASCASRYPSPWGIFDTHGNAAEITHYLGNRSPAEPETPAVSGGFYGMNSAFVSSSSHMTMGVDSRMHTSGIRVARSLPKWRQTSLGPSPGFDVHGRGNHIVGLVHD